MRRAATTLIVLTVPVMVALPALGHAQAPTITRASSVGSMPPDSSVGLLRGALPQGATTGVVRGTLPSGANGRADPVRPARCLGRRAPGHVLGREGSR